MYDQGDLRVIFVDMRTWTSARVCVCAYVCVCVRVARVCARRSASPRTQDRRMMLAEGGVVEGGAGRCLRSSTKVTARMLHDNARQAFGKPDSATADSRVAVVSKRLSQAWWVCKSREGPPSLGLSTNRKAQTNK